MRRSVIVVGAIGLAAAGAIAFVYGGGGGAPGGDAVLVTKDVAVSPSLDARADAPSVPACCDVNHVLGTGQSLSVGTVGVPALTLTQPYANIMFAGGVMPGDTNLVSFVPLVEGDTIPGSMMVVETMSSAFANLVTKLSRDEGQRSHDLLVSLHGIGAQPYSALKKGGTLAAYATGMAQAKAAHDLTLSAGKTYVVRAVTNVHGETDHALGNTSYQANLLEWQADYEGDIVALTHQTEPIPMFETQISNWPKMGGTTSIIPAQQLGAHVAAPGRVILVGPKYHLPYASDGVHLTNEGYRHMGEDYAKAYRRVVLEHGTWEPLRPKSVTLAGAVVTIVFFVPAPPLVIDKKLVTDPGHLGFEYADDAGAAAPTIASVALASADTLTVTLSAAPTAANRHIRYAFTGAPGAAAGPTTGPRGNLRDSDATASRSGYPLYNWCVHFDERLP